MESCLGAGDWCSYENSGAIECPRRHTTIDAWSTALFNALPCAQPTAFNCAVKRKASALRVSTCAPTSAPLFSSRAQGDLSTPANHAPAPAEIAAPMGVKAV